MNIDTANDTEQSSVSEVASSDWLADFTRMAEDPQEGDKISHNGETIEVGSVYYDQSDRVGWLLLRKTGSKTYFTDTTEKWRFMIMNFAKLRPTVSLANIEHRQP